MPVKFWLIKPFHFYCVCAQYHQPRFDLLLKNPVTQSETLRWQIESLQEALADGAHFHPGKCFTVHAASPGVALCASTGRRCCAARVRKDISRMSFHGPGFPLCSRFQISHAVVAEVLLSLPTVLNAFSWINPTHITTCFCTESLANEVNRLIQVIKVSQDRKIGKEPL